MSNISDTNNKNKVNFTYFSANTLTKNELTDEVMINDFPNFPGYYLNDAIKVGITNIEKKSITNIFQKYLNKIEFINGKVEFIYSTREDIDAVCVKEINIYNKLNVSFKLIKKIVFNYFYDISNESTDKRMFLKDVKIQDTNMNNEEYLFSYNGLKLPNYLSRSVDFWGVFNNRENSILIPESYTQIYNQFSITNSRLGTANMNTDSVYSQAGILNQIIYPTKGYTIFEYENNKFLDKESNKTINIGSLRIKKINNFDNNNNLISYKYYKYGQNECGYGIKNFIFKPLGNSFSINYSNEMLHFNQEQNGAFRILVNRTRSINSKSFMYSDAIDGSLVFYDEVSEYIFNSIQNKDLKTTYYYFADADDYRYIETIFDKYKPYCISNHLKRGLLF